MEDGLERMSHSHTLLKKKVKLIQSTEKKEPQLTSHNNKCIINCDENKCSAYHIKKNN